jgi:hypothetical protein
MSNSWTKTAKALVKHDPQISWDMLHQRLCGEASLFGKAYFGHKSSSKEKALIRYLWKVSNKVLIQS